MVILYIVLALLFGGALVSLCLGRNRNALAVASCATLGASGLGLVFALHSLITGKVLTSSLALPMPLGSCTFSVDPLSAVFLLPVFLMSAVGGLLLPDRVKALEGVHDIGSIHYGRHGFFYCLLSGATVLVLSASDAVFFLISWEVMSLTPFFLISPQDKDAGERHSTWIYLLAAHLGVLPLLFMFAAMSVEAGATDFSAFFDFARGSLVGASGGGWNMPGLLFVLAVVGFGVKAGLAPLHMWMPEAYSSAPGHVAVLLSGAMLNLGIYGIARMILLLGPPEDWWAYTLIGVGAFSGILGVLLAIAQADIKRTLAYSSTENMGIVCLALGAGLLACLHEITLAATLFLGGAVLHIWNHSIFKSLLFLGANAVQESIHITTIQHLGGLQKRLPVTGGCFAAGCAAIAGIPPFNGFMGELLVYMGCAFGSDAVRGSWTSLVFWLVFVALAIIAGMAVFAFTRMYGLAFLGAPRSERSRLAEEPEPALQRIMAGGAVLCLAVSFAAPLLFIMLSDFLVWFSEGLAVRALLNPQDFVVGKHALAWYSLIGVLLVFFVGGGWFFLRKKVERNGEESGPTWDCGYRYPSARMQYTGGSFAHSLALMLKPLIRAKMNVPVIRGLFPSEPKAAMSTPDWPTALWESLLFRPIAYLSDKAKGMQQGLVNLYILYILLALIAALVWALGGE